MATKAGHDMADSLQLAKTLATHDAAITGLGSRMSGVENGLNHVNEKVSTLDSRVAQGFGEVLSQIRESKASQGPGLSETVKIVVGGASLVVMAAAAVTFLVTSHVEPRLLEIANKTEALTSLRSRDEQERQKELELLREERREKIDTVLERLAEQVKDIDAKAGWAATVERKK
jgi:hypothetical protein